MHSDLPESPQRGIRYNLHVNMDEVPAFAAWMIWECALIDLTFGVLKGYSA